jgi:hypothetical protein
MFLVIFGAGASFDSVPTASRTQSPTHPLRPPLADDLFSATRPAFVEAAYDWHEGAGLIGQIRGRIASQGGGVEEALEHFADEAARGHPETIRALVAIRYYIAEVIARCANSWSRDHGRVTNYRILFHWLELWRASHDDKALLVTFNYDELLDEALESSGRGLDDIDDYVSAEEFRLIKPHGSTSWLRGILPSGDSHDIIRAAPSLDLHTGPITKRVLPPDHTSAVPAIAIPTQTKTSFECPPEHLAALEEWLPKVDRILVIGWRAQERHFLKLLQQHLGEMNGVEGLVVSDSKQGADATILALEKVLPDAHLHPSTATGFSTFVETDKPVTTWLEGRLHSRLAADDPDHRAVNLM